MLITCLPPKIERDNIENVYSKKKKGGCVENKSVISYLAFVQLFHFSINYNSVYSVIRKL